MFFNPEAKRSTSSISVHAELIMYGDVFIYISKDGDKGITVNWLSLCDGGDIADRGEKSYSDVSFQDIVDHFYGIDFPEQEDENMNVSWEIQCYDQDEETVVEHSSGYWRREMITGIINWLRETVKDERPFLSVLETLNA